MKIEVVINYWNNSTDLKFYKLRGMIFIKQKIEYQFEKFGECTIQRTVKTVLPE